MFARPLVHVAPLDRGEAALPDAPGQRGAPPPQAESVAGAPSRLRRAEVRRTEAPSAAPDLTPVLRGWAVDRQLAAGAQADVFLVRPAADADARDDRQYAAKVFRRRGVDGTPLSAEEQQWRMLREVIALRLLESAPGCSTARVVTFGTCLAPDSRESRPWYVMPHYEAGAMWQPGADGASGIGRWSEHYRGNIGRVLEIVASLAATLAAMHDQPRRIVHRDVTAANVLFAHRGGPPILGDFGIALVDGFTSRPPRTTWSIPDLWRPPELDFGDGYRVGPEADVFMLGGLIYQTLSGGRLLPPSREWDGDFVHSRPAHTLRQDADDPRVVAVEALLERMLARSPARRLPAREVARVCRAISGLPRTVSGAELR